MDVIICCLMLFYTCFCVVVACDFGRDEHEDEVLLTKFMFLKFDRDECGSCISPWGSIC